MSNQELSALLKKGKNAARSRDRDAAKKYFDEATRQFPESADPWYYRGLVETDSQKQRRYFQQALKVDPTHAGAREKLQVAEPAVPKLEIDSPRLEIDSPRPEIDSPPGAGEDSPEESKPTAPLRPLQRQRQRTRRSASNNEVTRLLGAQIVLDPDFRRFVRAIYSEHTSVAPEFNLDVETLMRIAVSLENQQTRSAWMRIGLQVGSLLFFLSGLLIHPIGWLLFLISTVASFWVIFQQNRRSFSDEIKAFDKDAFDIDKIKTMFPVRDDDEALANLPKANQNFIAYSRFIPFVGAGQFLGGWQIPVAIPVTNSSNFFTESDLYAAIDDHLSNLEIADFETRDYLFAAGEDVERHPVFFDQQKNRPHQVLSEADLDGFKNRQSYVARYYKWISVASWNGEIVNSFFLRFALQGNVLFIEFSKYLLTPVDPNFKDLLVVKTKSTSDLAYESVWDTVFALISSPWRLVTLIISVITWVLNRFSKGEKAPDLSNIVVFGGIKSDRGALTTLREHVAANKFQHFFQRMDSDMYTKIIEREIKACISEFLEAHDVDASEFSRKLQTIIDNSSTVNNQYNGNISINGTQTVEGDTTVGENAGNPLGILRKIGNNEQSEV